MRISLNSSDEYLVLVPCVVMPGAKPQRAVEEASTLRENLHRLGVSDKVIQQILRHANVTTTIKIYVKMVTRDAEDAMKTPRLSVVRRSQTSNPNTRSGSPVFSCI